MTRKLNWNSKLSRILSEGMLDIMWSLENMQQSRDLEVATVKYELQTSCRKTGRVYTTVFSIRGMLIVPPRLSVGCLQPSWGGPGAAGFSSVLALRFFPSLSSIKIVPGKHRKNLINANVPWMKFGNSDDSRHIKVLNVLSSVLFVSAYMLNLIREQEWKF